MDFFNADTLPVIFAGLMALSLWLYVILDGYDLGVGILLPFTKTIHDKNKMISSIGPFWDANETWLVLGIGLLLVAFPKAHGMILGELYLPVALMLIGLILRGVAFDFRVKVKTAHQLTWNYIFAFGSLLASLMQGIMLGRYITGFAEGYFAWGFALLVGIGLSFAYVLLGASWLLMKMEGSLQTSTLHWIKNSLLCVAAMVCLISIISPFANQVIFDKWFVLPNFFYLSPLPLLSFGLFIFLFCYLPKLQKYQANKNDKGCWIPFVCSVGIMSLAYIGLAYSVFPDIIVGRLTIWEAASDPEALRIILWGTLVVLPTILAYSIFSYYVFRGKATDLSYD
ncbi:cytochrome bd ubiquinol oxidase subunit II [Gammaproteobacteria bacterium]|nr:cytochrome bd ubiquinol oxidase subunit II [Gammaproteobacteria bacterium]